MIEGQELAERLAKNRFTMDGRKTLANREDTIMESLRQTAMCLKDIEQGELWRHAEGVEYSSMEDYCQKRWGFGTRRRQQILHAENVRLALADVVEEPEAKLFLENVKEGHVRAIEEVPVYDRPKLVVEVSKTVDHPKASDIRETAKRLGMKVASKVRAPKKHEKQICPLCNGIF